MPFDRGSYPARVAWRRARGDAEQLALPLGEAATVRRVQPLDWLGRAGPQALALRAYKRFSASADAPAAGITDAEIKRCARCGRSAQGTAPRTGLPRTAPQRGGILAVARAGAATKSVRPQAPAFCFALPWRGFHLVGRAVCGQ